MTKLYRARWVLPVSSDPITDGAIVVADTRITAVGEFQPLASKYPDSIVEDVGEAAILPGFVNAHTHLELTAMRGFLEGEEKDFFAWLRKLTIARLERMTADDLYVSVMWGACEAIRAGVTSVGDASDSAVASMNALREAGLRGIVYQESFGPDPKLVAENFSKLKQKLAELADRETPLVHRGVSPHAPYTVCAEQLELISSFAVAEKLPLMMHAAESKFEEMLLKNGSGPFAEGYAKRGIAWPTPGMSTVKYLELHGVLEAKPLLTHCITVDAEDIEVIRMSGACIAHCPKSNAKLGHGRAPFQAFLDAGIPTGLGSDSVASNNLCDLLEEARFAVLSARAALAGVPSIPSAKDALFASTGGGAKALGVSDHTGVLEAGKQAEFTAIGLQGVHQQPAYDPYSTLVFASSARDVQMTVVAGKEIYRDGRVLTLDEERLAARMNEIAKKLSQKHRG